MSKNLQQIANAEKLRLWKLLEQREQLRKENGLAFYEPHRKQEIFHSSGHLKYRFVRTGNRWGKSQCGAAEDIAHALGERPWYPKDDERRYKGILKRPSKGVILVYDWGKAKEIFTSMDYGSEGKLFQWLPKKHFEGVEKTNNGEVCAIKIRSVWGGTSYIYIDTVKSFLQNPMGHESSNWDWVHVDEPIPQDMWKAYARGLMDSGGKAWFLCTPLNQPWITDFFLPNREVVVDPDNGTVFDDKRLVLIGSTFDNPHIKSEEIEEFANGLTEQEVDCRIHGKQLSMGGVVYNNFSMRHNVYREPPHGWEAMDKPPKSYAIRYALDPHPRTPDAVLFAATAPSGEVFFFAEYFQRADPQVLAEYIIEKTEGYNVVGAICDPAGFIENPITGTTYADELTVYGLFFEKSSKDLGRGIVMTNAALKETMPQGHRKLHFSVDLHRTLWEIERYEWDIKKMDRPVDKDDHMMENLYRLVVDGLDYVKPIEERHRFYGQADAELNWSLPTYD